MKRDSFPLNYVPLGEPSLQFTHIHVSFMAEVFTHIDWTAGCFLPPFDCLIATGLLTYSMHETFIPNFIWIGTGNTIPSKNWSTEYIGIEMK